jgi:hypothetical protein
LYDYETYAIGSYSSGTSVFFTGIRWANLFSDDAKSNQLINELENLANVVKPHSAAMRMRLKATVHSYRHWRRNLMLSCAAYMIGDAINNGFEKSIPNEFRKGGLSNLGKITFNHAFNIYEGTKYLGKGIGAGAQMSWNWVIKPAGKFILGGTNAFKVQESQSPVVQVNPKIDFMPGLKNNEQAARDDLHSLEMEDRAKIKAEFDNQKPMKKFNDVGVQIYNSGNYTWSDLTRLGLQLSDRKIRKQEWIDWMYPSSDIEKPVIQKNHDVVPSVPQHHEIKKSEVVTSKPILPISEKKAEPVLPQIEEPVFEKKKTRREEFEKILFSDRYEGQPDGEALNDGKESLLAPVLTAIGGHLKGFVAGKINVAKEKVTKVKDVVVGCVTEKFSSVKDTVVIAS